MRTERPMTRNLGLNQQVVFPKSWVSQGGPVIPSREDLELILSPSIVLIPDGPTS